jgi:hypothetical protein
VVLPDKEVNSLPMAIPPAIVGVLVHQKVRAREIAATLVDLAIRGDILIIDRERGFAFGKGKFDQRLLGYEKILLSKIFRNNLAPIGSRSSRGSTTIFTAKKSLSFRPVFTLFRPVLATLSQIRSVSTPSIDWLEFSRFSWAWAVLL